MSLPPAWAAVANEAKRLKTTHLRDLLQNQARNDSMYVQSGDFVLDYSRQKVDTEAMEKLFALAATMDVEGKRKKMYDGVAINQTEERSALHVALRAAREQVMVDDKGKNVVPDVWNVLDGIQAFSDKVRRGEWLGHTGKPLTDVLAIGIGGSYLGVEFVYEALRTDPEAAVAAKGRRLRWLANVDPIDVKRALEAITQRRLSC